jgi:hypothetical protein
LASKFAKKCLPVYDPIFFSHYNHIWVSKFRISEFDADLKFRSVEKVEEKFIEKKAEGLRTFAHCTKR